MASTFMGQGLIRFREVRSSGDEPRGAGARLPRVKSADVVAAWEINRTVETIQFDWLKALGLTEPREVWGLSPIFSFHFGNDAPVNGGRPIAGRP